MRWARSKFLSRVLAVLLIGSMLPPLLAPSNRAASSSLYGSYSEWLRAQLLVPADATFERALLGATESKAKSFEQFIDAFFQAYEAHGPDAPVSKAFTGRDLSNEALWSYLQRRYTRIAGEGVLTRLRFAAASGGTFASASADAAFAAGSTPSVPISADSWRRRGATDHLISVGTLTSARPQGP